MCATDEAQTGAAATTCQRVCGGEPPAPTAPARILCTCVHSGWGQHPDRSLWGTHGARPWSLAMVWTQQASEPYLTPDVLIAGTSALTNN